MTITFPGESTTYREARNALLEKEVRLREQIEEVARLRRSLPDGGAPRENYVFTDSHGQTVHLSDLFTRAEGTLALYSLMYRPDADTPCPMCVSLLDALDGQSPHIDQRMDFAVVAAATPAQLAALAKNRGWTRLKLLSADGTSYQSDYLAQDKTGAQLPMMNVFRKTPDGIRHFWGSEGFYADVDGQPRHMDLIWPLWNVFDLTPEGRGKDWYPQLSY